MVIYSEINIQMLRTFFTMLTFPVQHCHQVVQPLTYFQQPPFVHSSGFSKWEEVQSERLTKTPANSSTSWIGTSCSRIKWSPSPLKRIVLILILRYSEYPSAKMWLRTQASKSLNQHQICLYLKQVRKRFFGTLPGLTDYTQKFA